MRIEEADTLARWILDLGLPRGTVCLNVGSSTDNFRKVEQPHIDSRFIRPLEAAGIRFIHCDLKNAAGVDEVGNVLDPDFQARLEAHHAGLLVCSNLLEHLPEPVSFARACGKLVRGGGHVVFSVPSSYPYHPDPIDSMLRLRPAELTALFPEWAVIKAGEIEAGSLWTDLQQSGQPLRLFARQLARVAVPFYRPRHWHPIASRLTWLGRPYRVSIALLRKPEDLHD
jgi:SAM-dependent methyltransferase